MLPIELLPTTPDQAELIRNLYQFYAYESSDWEQEDVEVDGRFYIHEAHLQRYWQAPAGAPTWCCSMATSQASC